MNKTFTEEFAEEEERLRRRFVYHTRQRRPLTLVEAVELAARVETPPEKVQ